MWLLAEFGDGISVTCSFNCGTVLLYSTLYVDRFPVPGVEGGRYTSGNIRPSCGPCNSRDGAHLGHRRRKQ